MEPPAKKAKLKLNVRPRKSDESNVDTIVVSRPRRTPSVKLHHDEILSRATKNAPPKPAETRPTALHAPVTSASDDIGSSEEPSTSTRDDYGDFMSYYIAGSDEEGPAPEKRSKRVSKPTRKSEGAVGKASRIVAPPSQQRRSLPIPTALPQGVNSPHASKSTPKRPQKPSSSQAKTNGRSVSQSMPATTTGVAPSMPAGHPHPLGAHTYAPPPPHPVPQPTVQIIELPQEPRPSQPDTVAVMLSKLERLSVALTNFGAAQSSQPNTTPSDQQVSDAPAKSEDEPQAVADESVVDLNFRLDISEKDDMPLIYGIQFIMSALRSWAEQRLKQQFIQQYEHQQFMAQQQGPHMATKEGEPVRPELQFQLPAQPIIQLNLADTPEGVAIAAFQAVLDCGCLQLNVKLPTPLARALSRLYTQIDHLINQGPLHEPPWECMSYAAQNAAHQSRVNAWNEAHKQAIADASMQQQLMQQHTMQQMDAAGHLRYPIDMAHEAHARELELQRHHNTFPAMQPPQYQHHPLDPRYLATSQTPIGMHHGMGMGPGIMHGPPAFNHADAGAVQLDKMKLYMPGFLPRSGQSMKFSFAPDNEAAVRVFGPQAFPSNVPVASNIPNRGPMRPLPGQPTPDSQKPGKVVNKGHKAGIPKDAEVIELQSSSPQRVKVSKSSATGVDGHASSPGRSRRAPKAKSKSRMSASDSTSNAMGAKMADGATIEVSSEA